MILQDNCDKGWGGQGGHCQDWPVLLFHCQATVCGGMWKSWGCEGQDSHRISGKLHLWNVTGFLRELFNPPCLLQEEMVSWKNLLKTFESVYEEEGPCRSLMIWVTSPKVSALGGFLFRFLILDGFIYRSTGVVFWESFSFRFLKPNTFKSKRPKPTCYHLKLQSMVLEAELGVMCRDLVRIRTT